MPLTSEQLTKVAIVRTALKHFAHEAPGCGDVECGICGKNHRIAKEAVAALDDLVGLETEVGDAHS